MHELSIVQNIIEIVLSEMPKQNISRVKTISLRIGKMRHVAPGTLYFAFECLSQNTPLEGAEVKIENIPIKGRCRTCRREFILENWLESCRNCGQNHVEIISGKELEIVEFEGS